MQYNEDNLKAILAESWRTVLCGVVSFVND